MVESGRQWLHNLQMQRLDSACKAADLAIDTSGLRAQAVVEQVVAYLEERDTADAQFVENLVPGWSTLAPPIPVA